MTLNELIAKYGLEKINSATKYPSILTYHQLGVKGGLKNELIDKFPDGVELEITEKVDGTNGRIICLGGDYLIGQRDQFVYAQGDRIVNSEIVKVIQDLPNFDNVQKYSLEHNDKLIAIYGEVYGYRIQDGSKVYCGNNSNSRNYRIFDVWEMDINAFDEYLSTSSQEKITYDREHGWQPFFPTVELEKLSKELGIERTPIWATICSNDMPIDVIATKAWIEDNFIKSKAVIDDTPNSNQKFGRAEGVVIRTLDRKMIRKLRFEDYHKGQLKGWV